MSNVVGEVVYLAKIDTAEYKKGVREIESANSGLETSANKAHGNISGSFSKIGSSAVAAGRVIAKGLAVASLAVVGIVSASVKSYADYEQLVGGVDTLFKESSKKLQGYASQAYKTAGISANKYMEQVTSFSASLLQGLGGDTAKASDYANQAIIDMADNANKMGTSMESIQNAYQGFAKQNYSMLDNLKLGYGGTQQEMFRLLQDAKKIDSTFDAVFSIDERGHLKAGFADITRAIHIVQTEIGITGTTAEEASSTISGSFNSMKASWTDLMVGMTNPDADISTILANFLASVTTFGQNLVPAITTALKGIVGIIDGIASMLIKELPTLLKTLLPIVITTFTNLLLLLAQSLPVLVPILVTGVTNLLTSLVGMLPTLIPLVVQGFFDLLKGLLKAIPLVIPALIKSITSLINSVIGMLYEPAFLRSLILASLALFMGIVQAIPQIIIALIEALPTIISSLVAFLVDPVVIKEVIKAAAILFGALVLAVPQILGALVSAFGNLIAQLWTKISHNFSQFGANFGNSIGDAVKNGINSALRWVIWQVNSIIDMVNKGLAAIDKILPGDQSGVRVPRLAVPQLAEGGIVTQPTLAMVGEGRESEAVIPLSKLDEIINGEGGGRFEYNIGTINIGSEVDGEAWLKKLTRNQEIIGRGMTPLTRY